MKKKIYLVLAMTMLLSCTGCGSYEKKIANNTNSVMTEENQTEQESDENSEIAKNETKDLSDWGVTECFPVEKDDKIIACYINFPQLLGIQQGTGEIAYQNDDSLVLIDGQIGDMSPVVEDEKVENVLPAYFEQTRTIMEDYWPSNYTNIDFELDGGHGMTYINGYDMCIYTGAHTYTDGDGVDHKLYFKAYATKLKTNGAFVYWMVMNRGGNNEFNVTVDEYANNMAYTLQEEK